MTEREQKLMAYVHGELSEADSQALQLTMTEDEKAFVAEMRAFDSSLSQTLKQEAMPGLNPEELHNLVRKAQTTEKPSRTSSWWNRLSVVVPTLAAAAALTLFVWPTTNQVEKVQNDAAITKGSGTVAKKKRGGRKESRSQFKQAERKRLPVKKPSAKTLGLTQGGPPASAPAGAPADDFGGVGAAPKKADYRAMESDGAGKWETYGRANKVAGAAEKAEVADVAMEAAITISGIESTRMDKEVIRKRLEARELPLAKCFLSTSPVSVQVTVDPKGHVSKVDVLGIENPCLEEVLKSISFPPRKGKRRFSFTVGIANGQP